MTTAFLQIAFYLWISVLPKHDFHTSIAEMDYNSKNRSFEVSLRVFTDDLEQALDIKQSGLSNTTFEKEITAYLQDQFYIKKKDKKLPFQYIGKEVKTNVTWLYFEIPVKGSTDGLTLVNAVLTDLFSDQMNIVNLQYKNQKETLLFQRGKTSQALNF